MINGAQSLQMGMIMHRSATFESGKFGSLFEKILSSVEQNMGKLVVKICFVFKHVKIQGYFLVVFDEHKLNAILQSDVVLLK